MWLVELVWAISLSLSCVSLLVTHRTSSILSRIQSIRAHCLLAVGGGEEGMYWRNLYGLIKLMLVLSTSPSPPASTLLQNLGVP